MKKTHRSAKLLSEKNRVLAKCKWKPSRLGKAVMAWMLKSGTADLARSLECVYPSETLALEEAKRISGYYPAFLQVPPLRPVEVEIREVVSVPRVSERNVPQRASQRSVAQKEKRGSRK